MKILSTRKTTAIVEQLDVSAREWQLFTFDDEHRVPSEKAAKRLNSMIMEACNLGKSRQEVTSIIGEVMWQERGTGACDTEPRGVLHDILDSIFGDNEYEK